MYRLAFIVACFIASVFGADVSESDEQKVFTYTGNVISPKSEAVGGAKVYLLPNRELLAETNDQGEFVFDKKGVTKKDVFDIEIKHEQMNLGNIKRVMFLSIGKIILFPMMSIEGTIVTEDGQAIKKPMIVIEQLAIGNVKGSGQAIYEDNIELDSSGRFHISGLIKSNLYGGGGYMIFIQADGYGRKTQKVWMKGYGKKPLDAGKIVLPKEYPAIRGAVLDTNGSPIEGAKVSIEIKNMLTRDPIVTEANGLFAFEDIIDEGQKIITTECPGYPSNKTILDTGQMYAFIVLGHNSMTYISGDRCLQKELTKSSYFSYRSNHRSILKALGKPDKDYATVLNDCAVDTEKSELDALESQQAKISQKIYPGFGRADLKVIDAFSSEPVGCAWIIIEKVMPVSVFRVIGTGSFLVFAKADGSFSMVVPKGQYYIAQAGRWDCYSKAEDVGVLNIESEKTITKNIELLPVNNTLIKIVDENDNSLENAEFSFNNDHSARSQNKGDGYYWLSWKRDLDSKAITPVLLNVPGTERSAIVFLDSQSESIEIVAMCPVKLKGRLLGIDGKSVPGKVDICLIDEKLPEPFDRREVRVDSNGYFEFEKLISGYSYQLTALTTPHKQDEALAKRIKIDAQDMKAGETKNVDIQFIKGNLSVSGIVTNAEGNIPQILSVTASGENQPLVLSNRMLNRTRPFNEFLIEGLVEGKVTLEIYAIIMRPVGGGISKSHKVKKVVEVVAGSENNNIVIK